MAMIIHHPAAMIFASDSAITSTEKMQYITLPPTLDLAMWLILTKEMLVDRTWAKA